MKTIEVIAYHGQGQTRTFAGKTSVKVPENLDEAKKMEGWGVERTLARAIGSYVIEVQRSLRGPKAMSEAEKAFKALPKAEQDRLLGISAKKAPAKKRPTVRKRKAGSTETVEVTPPTEQV
jgi:hypothetical protein